LLPSSSRRFSTPLKEEEGKMFNGKNVVAAEREKKKEAATGILTSLH
jgi:hypothetical protein